jgi:GPH family glycoside/pentoside/hexuronide:cation symporter
MNNKQEISKENILTKVKLKEKIGYGIGDLGFNFYWSNITSFLLFFYTDVFGISALVAGTMITVTKILDALVDPVVGIIADRTDTRFGKFRPYFIWGSLPLAAALVLVYTIPNFSETGKLIWAYGTLILMMALYSLINIPYGALSGVITGNSQERTTLISFRFIAGSLGGVLVTYFTLDLVKFFGNGNAPLGWQMTMGLSGILAAIIFGVVFLTTRERIKPSPKQHTKVSVDIKDLLHNRPFLIISGQALLIMITIIIRGGASIYYVKYFLGRPDLIKYFITIYMIALAIGAAITPLLTKYVDKKRLMVICMGTAGILCISFFFIPKDMIWLIFTMHFLVGLSLGPKSPLAFSMFADTADYTEWKTGRRATAITFAAATFAQKLGWALSSFIIGLVLTAVGYVANTEQTSSSQEGILIVISIIPGIIALCAAFIMRFYPLDNVLLAKVQSELKERKEKETEQ